MATRRVFSLVRSLSGEPMAFRLRQSTQLQFIRNLTIPSRTAFSEALPSKKAEFEHLVNKMRRPMTRKRRPLTASISQKSREKSVVALALAESFDLHAIAHDVAFNSMYNTNFIDEEYDDALYIVKKTEYTVNKELSEMYVFEDGVVVFWNMEANQRANILRELERFADCQYDSKIALEEQDRMPFSLIEGESCIRSDRFFLNMNKHDTGKASSSSILERYAFSQGFAASVKIGVWEALLNEMSEPLSISTRSLKEGIIPWKRKEALVKSGEFAALRHSINLDCNLLNSDFYWNRENIEKYYDISSRHFMLNRRLTALNKRLDYCEELVKMVDNMLALRHASTLEWMIIVLIVIEVIFDIFHFTDRSPQKVVVVSEPVETPV